MERVANPLGNNMPNFNYRGNGYNNQGDPKPPFVPPPQARPGFGRNTAEDLAFVCPSCEEELKYDPDAEAAKARPAKKARNRKDREEHHFWAVKECGHVYCKKCFDERRPSKKYSGPPKTKFRPVDQKTILCAIEDCTSDVGPKGNWVGLFL
ncbi:hypothetical protein QBC39DRAFT_258700 [Podospora conica]|nr:hypothetical protein QBC39DRAFT_258700 [Schizothecium conicum]